MPTQNEYNVVKKQQRIESIKIQLLNFKYQVVDELQGNVVGQPTFNNNSDSDIRRTCNFTIIPTDSSFDITYGSKIWLDKYVKIYKGIKVNQYDEDYEWTNMGIYLVDNPNQTYNATTNTISISGLDLMSKLTGLRNGNLDGIPYSIPQGSNIREAMISLLELAGFTNYSIDDVKITIDSTTTTNTPYEIKVDVGGTIYNLLTQLRDIVSDYQMYFDVDGVFCFNRIPSGKNQQIIVDDDIWNNVLINYSRNISYSDIKNSIIVLGKTHDVSHFGNGTVTTDSSGNSICSCSISSFVSTFSSTSDGTVFGFTTNQDISVSGNNIIKLKINSNTAFPLCEESISASTMIKTLTKDVYYVVKFVWNSGESYFDFLGQVQPTAEVKETNPLSPYYVNGSMGEVRIVLSGGEYDNIYSDSLALQRAKYELYRRCRLNDSVTINCVPIYWLDTNMAISITLPNKQGIEETNNYLIKSISTSNNQSITLMRLYDEQEEKKEETIDVLTADDLSKIGISSSATELTLSKTYETASTIYHVNSFESGLFSFNSSLQSVTIDDDIEDIPNCLFQGCDNLSEIIISENSNLKRIGRYAFEGCDINSYSMQSFMDNPKHLEYIEDYAFNNGWGNDYASFSFYLKINETNLKYLKKIGAYAFNSGGTKCDFYLYIDKTYESSSTLQEIGDYAFRYTGLRGINCFKFNSNDGIKLGKYCFANCSKIEKIIDFPYSFENGEIVIPESLFANCYLSECKDGYSRSSLYLNYDTTKIGDCAFSNMYTYNSGTYLKYIVAQDTVTSIGTNAFQNTKYRYNGTASGSPWGGTAV